MRLRQTAFEGRAHVGQREPFTPAQGMVFGKAQSGDSVRGRGLHGNELQHIELARRTEQYAAFVLRFAR